jgi:hypothetical protein
MTLTQGTEDTRARRSSELVALGGFSFIFVVDRQGNNYV